MTNPRRELVFLIGFVFVVSLLVVAQGESPSEDDKNAGPVVKTHTERVEAKGDADGAPAPSPGNGTDSEKKKTIAQMLDEALEQEFPEEKTESIGKNYNETAQHEDVRQHIQRRDCICVYCI
jgi:hypothetical protein